MRKALTTIILLLTLSLTPARAGVNFGIRFGANIMNMYVSSDVLKAENKNGFFVGPVLRIGAPVGFGMELAALYDERVFEGECNTSSLTENEGNTFTAKKKSIDLQLNIRKSFGLGNQANFFLFAGPQIGLNIGDKDILNLDTYRNISWEEQDVSINMGLGFTLLKHFELRANYNLACGKTGEIKSLETGSEALTNAIINTWNGKLHSNAWQIGVTYYF